MLGLRRNRTAINEHEADGDVERIYHEIRQTLRVTGVSLNFRVWATFERFFPAMWSAIRPSVETRAFEDAADRLRARAVELATALGPVDAASRVRLGPSQAHQLSSALFLYHYMNPKLLLLTSSIRAALEGNGFLRDGRGDGQTGRRELIELGPPEDMPPMEVLSEDPDDRWLRELFDDVKKTLELELIASDYRTLALWPEYLGTAWGGLKDVVTREAFRNAAGELREAARTDARSLPYPFALTRQRIRDLGDDAEEVSRSVLSFERNLPCAILNIALLALDWRSPDVLARSPFPARQRGSFGGVPS